MLLLISEIPDKTWQKEGKSLNPEFAVAIYCGLKILAATLVYCFEIPVLLTGSQKETITTFVPYLFYPPDETKLPVVRVVVCDMILLLNIIMIMPASQNHSNCAFRCGLLRLATKPTAKSGFNRVGETKKSSIPKFLNPEILNDLFLISHNMNRMG